MKGKLRFNLMGPLIAIGLPLVLLAVVLLWLGWQAEPVYAATIIVDDDTGDDDLACGTAGSPCRTIPYALINRADAGDIVFVLAGTYTETFSMEAGVVISGAGAGVTFIDGEDTRGPMVTASVSGITNSAVLRGFTIRRGSATNGGGLSITGGASPLVKDCVVSENQVTGSGGGLYLFGDMTVILSGTQVLSNTAAVRGGGLYQAGLTPGGEVKVIGGRFENNVATGNEGGGFWIWGNVALTETQVISNSAGEFGGGLYQYDDGGRVEVSGGRFERNVAKDIGFGAGGGLYVRGSVALTGTWVVSNSAGQRGGGLYAAYATLDRVRAVGNTAGGAGGGLYVTQRAVVTGTQVLRNTAAQRGGGLYGERAVEAVNSLFVANAAWAGAGLYMYGTDAAQATLRHLTVVSPAVGSAYPQAAAVLARGGTVNITNTIITSYPYGIEAFGAAVYEDYNLYFGNGTDFLESASTITSGGNSLHGLDPRFVDPATDDYHIGTDSAALDAGAFGLGVTDDIDGDSRPTNTAQPDAPDIGYDENASLTVRRPVTDTMTFGAACARLVFADRGSLSAITVTVVYTYPEGEIAATTLPRNYTISAGGSGPYTASLALCYTDAGVSEAGVTHEEVLRLYRFDGSNWHIYASDVDTTGNVVTATQVVTFSQWALGQRSPTAMYIASFTAVPIVKGILLEWETATEIDNLGFNLYRADDPVGELLRLNEVLIPSQMPGSSIGVRYQFVDRLAEPGVTYYYWLEDMNVHGIAARHGPVSVTVSARLPRLIYLPLVLR